MKASNLIEAIQIFDPREPLKGVELKSFYVNRPDNPRTDMMNLIQSMGLHGNHVKILFTGHTGSGKSTELNKLAEQLKNRFFIVPFAAQRSLPIAELTYVDVLLGMASALFRQATDRDVIAQAPAQIVQEFWGEISFFFEQTIFGAMPYRKPPQDAEYSVKLNFLAMEFQTKFTNEGSTRSDIRARVETQLGELIEKINLLADQVSVNYGRPVLFIVEGTDKPDLARAREIFLGHSTSLTELHACIVYTFPIGLRYSSDFTIIKNSFDEYYILPNLKIRHKDGSEDVDCKNNLLEIISKRMNDNLIDAEAQELIINASGGLMRTLVQLIQRASVSAVGRNSETIQVQDAKKAIGKEKSDLISILSQEDYVTLKARLNDKKIVSDVAVQNLLQGRALLEYSNGEVWCDVHPLIQDLIANG